MLTLALAVVTASTAVADQVTLKLLAEGASKKIGSYSPQRVNLSKEKPATITKEPADLLAPMYGKLATTGDEGVIFHVILDEPEGKPARLFIDSNGNGDLTDDAAPEWNSRETGEGEKKFQQYSGETKINLGTKSSPVDVSIAMYRFDRNDPGRAQLKDVLLYYRDYAAEGEINLGGKTYGILISDDMASGDFRGKELAADAAEKASSGVSLFIDVNGDGKFERKGETFDIRKPFNIGGTTYELTNVARNGTSLNVGKSSVTVAEVSLPPDHGIGKKITPFEAKSTDDRTVMFPGDYKGKIVMIDFWATWCGPCMKEVPGLVAAYKKFHDQGFEVLGISLDNEKSIEKLKPVTAEKGMTWTQVADGKYWQAEVAQLYAINSIPACFLVDGDSGEILAASSQLRGEQLQKTLEAALAKKFKH